MKYLPGSCLHSWHNRIKFTTFSSNSSRSVILAPAVKDISYVYVYKAFAYFCYKNSHEEGIGIGHIVE